MSTVEKSRTRDFVRVARGYAWRSDDDVWDQESYFAKARLFESARECDGATLSDWNLFELNGVDAVGDDS